jgi:putative addiction module antidote
MTKVTVKRIGNSLGIIIPNDVCIRERIEAGQALDLVEDGKGGFYVTRLDPELARQVETAERIMREDDDILRELARH